MTLVCKGSITGNWTHTNWKLNGVLLTQWSGNKFLDIEHGFFTTQLQYYTVTFEACNSTACLPAYSPTIGFD